MLKKKRDLSRAPTPYEVARDFLQISSTILLTFSIVILTMMEFLTTDWWVKYIRPWILFVLLAILIVVLYNVYRFRNNWVTWVKKK